MKRIWVMLLAVVFAAAGLATQVARADHHEKDKKAKAASTKADRLDGTIARTNKDTSTIVVRGKGGVERTIVYDSSTTWTKRNEAGAVLADFKDGSRIIAVGKFDDKGRLMATKIDLRAQ